MVVVWSLLAVQPIVLVRALLAALLWMFPVGETESALGRVREAEARARREASMAT